MTPLEQATVILTHEGFHIVDQPITIGSSNFVFDRVLATEQSLDLVILQDMTLASADRVQRDILAFSRSLDILGSRRNITLVLVGQPLDAEILDALGRVCRVLAIGPTDNDDRMREWLSVLLPLELPDTEAMRGNWRNEIQSRLPGEVTRVAQAYLNATEQGEAGVQAELRRRVERIAGPALS